MSANGWLQFAAFSSSCSLTVRPVGIYLARVLEGKRLGSIQFCAPSSGSSTSSAESMPTTR